MVHKLRGRIERREPASPGSAEIIVVTRGRDRVAQVTATADGRFEVDVPEDADTVVTFFGHDGSVLRRRFQDMGEGVDIEALEIPETEFPAGIAGQAWDSRQDRFVSGGEAILRRGRDVVATERLDANGEFHFEMSPANPLPAGSYRVVIEATGYPSAELAIEVTNDVTSYRVGRIDLAARRKA